MELDTKAWKILAAIQRDARLPLKALADEAGLSLPATSERLKRLEEAGVIDGYRALVDPESLGYSILAVIGITTPQPDKARLVEQLARMPEVLECLHVTGQDSFPLRVVTQDIRHLERFVGQINHFGETRTAIVMLGPYPDATTRAARVRRQLTSSATRNSVQSIAIHAGESHGPAQTSCRRPDVRRRGGRVR